MSVFVVAVGASGLLAERRVDAAIEALRDHPALSVLSCSSYYENPAVGGVTCARFVNAAVVVESALSPAALLHAARAVEARVGRVRGPKDGARAIDLDLVFGLDLAAPVRDPDVPHPRALARDFVVVPALEALGRAGRAAPFDLVLAARRVSFGGRLMKQARQPGAPV